MIWARRGFELSQCAMSYPVLHGDHCLIGGDVCARAREASRVLARIDTATKNAALVAIAAALRERTEEILAANERDLRAAGRPISARRCSIACDLDESGSRGSHRRSKRSRRCGDPVGEVIDGHRLPNGLDVRKVRVPLGVIAVVYEARPNVTIDAAGTVPEVGQCDRAARLLQRRALQRGALSSIAAEAAVDAGLPEGCIGLVAGGGRERARRAGHAGRADRPADSARRRGTEGGAEGRGKRAGHLCRIGQLPRLRRRFGRPGAMRLRSC